MLEDLINKDEQETLVAVRRNKALIIKEILDKFNNK
jgi:hypothetical protein